MPQSERAKIWDDFIAATYEDVRRLPLPEIPARSDRYAVIVEPRQHPHLEYVMRNIMYFLGPEWGLQVITGNTNREFVRDIVKDWGQVEITSMNRDNLSGIEYNLLKKTHGFWQLIKGRTIFWFESDCLLRRSGIDEFLGYDYVGAPWRREFAVSDHVRVGNGGLSLRSGEAMLEISRAANAHNGLIYPEDVFFCVNMHLARGRYRVATLDVAREFAVESLYHSDPIGIHKIWKYLPEAQVRRLLGSIHYGT